MLEKTPELLHQQGTSVPPPYEAHSIAPGSSVPRTADARDMFEEDAGATSPSSSDEAEDQPPAYSDSVPSSAAATDTKQQQRQALPATAPAPNFAPTIQLQIQTPGKAWLSWPSPTPPDPVPVFAVSPPPRHAGATGLLLPLPLPPDDDDVGTPSQTPSFVSIRPERRSGSCSLYLGGDLGGEAGPETSRARPVSSTTYRFGHGRPPRVRLVLPPGLAATTTTTGEEEGDGEEEEWDSFEVRSSGLLTRAAQFRTRRLGDFEWRYGSRKERRAAGADDLLVLERLVAATGSSSSGSSAATSRRAVAQLVRSGEHRDPGSGRSSAGNGGRLQVDLSPWEKRHRDMALVAAVTTCLVMLKREVDRRREQQIAVIASGAL
ncbi:uncharacterized protein E0L32_008047 [Thyridium curvatum]|uniref:Uncharacterized protein n=1 Tax=Thyridium curvatum TaxID=1093900 RepID=A0A507B352_9PEZI|nr:uncharacterized protein E0L32_008047 [Thyridium curvatum]TPX11010.1 hypothetical protein E0L32_008047 [Thyridium curvatum]